LELGFFMIKRLLITGGSGYLGARLTQLADAADYETHPTFFSTPITHRRAIQLDLRDKNKVDQTIRDLKPDVIIHQAVSNRNDDDIAAIAPAARHIVEAAIDHHIRLIHVSTDLVFDGEHPPYTEESTTAPVNPYGAAKAYADGLIARAMPEALIVRPSLIYGFDPIDKQTAWLVNGIKQKQTVKLFVDEYRCPIWVDNLAHVLLEVAESKLSGILNVAGPQRLNRWDYGMKMLNRLKIEPDGCVVKSSIAESGLKRPADLTLDVRKAQRVLRTRLMGVDEVVGEA